LISFKECLSEDVLYLLNVIQHTRACTHARTAHTLTQRTIQFCK